MTEEHDTEERVRARELNEFQVVDGLLREFYIKGKWNSFVRVAKEHKQEMEERIKSLESLIKSVERRIQDACTSSDHTFKAARTNDSSASGSGTPQIPPD